MIKNLLLSIILLVNLSSADESKNFYEVNRENVVLSLKLEIQELKKELDIIKKVIEKSNNKKNKDIKRAKAITKLKRDLRKGREIPFDIN